MADGVRSASTPYAQWLARTMASHLGCTWGLAETGASGPTGNRYGDAAGHTCIAVAGPVETLIAAGAGHAPHFEAWPVIGDAMARFLVAALKD